MNETSELFIRGSRRFYEGLDKVLATVDSPDEQWVHQTFNCPKRRIEELDELVKSGEMDPGIAEARRFSIEKPACRLAYKRVLNKWDTKDKLADVRAQYHRAVSRAELLHRSVEENIRRKEALREFDDVWFEIHTWHHAC